MSVPSCSGRPAAAAAAAAATMRAPEPLARKVQKVPVEREALHGMPYGLSEQTVRVIELEAALRSRSACSLVRRADTEECFQLFMQLDRQAQYRCYELLFREQIIEKGIEQFLKNPKCLLPILDQFGAEGLALKRLLETPRVELSRAFEAFKRLHPDQQMRCYELLCRQQIIGEGVEQFLTSPQVLLTKLTMKGRNVSILNHLRSEEPVLECFYQPRLVIPRGPSLHSDQRRPTLELLQEGRKPEQLKPSHMESPDSITLEGRCALLDNHIPYAIAAACLMRRAQEAGAQIPEDMRNALSNFVQESFASYQKAREEMSKRGRQACEDMRIQEEVAWAGVMRRFYKVKQSFAHNTVPDSTEQRELDLVSLGGYAVREPSRQPAAEKSEGERKSERKS